MRKFNVQLSYKILYSMFNASVRRLVDVHIQYLSTEVLNSVSHVYADQFAIIEHCVKIVCPQHTNRPREPFFNRGVKVKVKNQIHHVT